MSVRILKPENPNSCTQAISTHGRMAERIWEPVNPLRPEVQNSLITLCESHRLEWCGYISLDQDIFPIHNVHTDPKHNFYLDIDEAQHALDVIYEEKHSEVLGIWHTHPNNAPWPSARDLVGWPQPINWRYWIVTNNEVIEWRLLLEESVRDAGGYRPI